jgi:hypothetical protein
VTRASDQHPQGENSRSEVEGEACERGDAEGGRRPDSPSISSPPVEQARVCTVPVDPTDDMIEAGEAQLERCDEDMHNYVSGVTTDWDYGMEAEAVFRAMLAARPASPPPIPDERMRKALERLELLLTDPARGYCENIARARDFIAQTLSASPAPASATDYAYHCDDPACEYQGRRHPAPYCMPKSAPVSDKLEGEGLDRLIDMIISAYHTTRLCDVPAATHIRTKLGDRLLSAIRASLSSDEGAR